MSVCSRCGRTHSGICGIPAVTLGFGARIGGISSRVKNKTQFSVGGKPKMKPQNAAFLKGCLHKLEHMRKRLET